MKWLGGKSSISISKSNVIIRLPKTKQKLWQQWWWWHQHSEINDCFASFCCCCCWCSKLLVAAIAGNELKNRTLKKQFETIEKSESINWMCAIEMNAQLQLAAIGYLLDGAWFFQVVWVAFSNGLVFFSSFSSISFIFWHLKHYIFGKWQHEWT